MLNEQFSLNIAYSSQTLENSFTRTFRIHLKNHLISFRFSCDHDLKLLFSFIDQFNAFLIFFITFSILIYLQFHDFYMLIGRFFQSYHAKKPSFSSFTNFYFLFFSAGCPSLCLTSFRFSHIKNYS